MEFHLLSLPGLLILAVYFFAGVIDSISGGGGLITIPALMAAGIPIAYITGTNQCAAVVGMYAAVYRYIKSRRVHFSSAWMTLPFAAAGSMIGAKLNLWIPDHYLKGFMIIMIPVIAAFLLFNKDLGDEDHIDELNRSQIMLRSAVIGLVLGTYQGFYGPGVGTFFMLAYAGLLKLSLVSSTGNTKFVLGLSSIVSAATYALSGFVIWKIVIAATVVNTIGSYIGAGIAIRNGSKLIKKITIAVTGLLLIKILFFR